MNKNTIDGYPNLKPFTGADDPRRQNGRRKGSKNIATLVRSILDEDIDPSLIHSESLKELLAKNNSPMSYMEAIVQSQVLKAAGGDIRAAEWVVEQSDKAPDPDSFFNATEIVFEVVPPREPDADYCEQQRLIAEREAKILSGTPVCVES